MEFAYLAFKNITSLSVLSFLFGFFWSIWKENASLSENTRKWLTLYLLFGLGIKGGDAFLEPFLENPYFVLCTTGLLVIWGFFHPLFAYFVLRVSSKMERATAIAIAACFGSISIMTFVAATDFLDHLQVPYQSILVPLVAILEIPAILTGLFLAFQMDKKKQSWKELFFHPSMGAIFFGLFVGLAGSMVSSKALTMPLLALFQPALCLFLWEMGSKVARDRKQFHLFSPSLGFFGCYMPFLGGLIGLGLSYVLGLDVGSGTLVSVLTASVSCIAAPAAMQTALPHAKEAIYLPLALGIAFPFNILIGIPIYYQIALLILKRP